MTHPCHQIKAISFDGDMTLWDFEKVMRNSLAHALDELRKHSPGGMCADLTVDRMIEIRNVVAEELKGKRAMLEAIRLEAFRRTIAAVGCDNRKNRRVGFFDTDILGKDHKAEAAAQPASLRIGVPV